MTDFSAVPARQEAPLTSAEQEALQARLWTLLAKQVRLQTQGDRSSVREEEAAELLKSLLFSLRFQLENEGQSMRTLLTADLPALLKRAQHALQIEVQTAQTLYTVALRSVAAFGSRALRDTLAGIGPFFKQYDLRLHAHAIPASIDYPLCTPVPETLQGVLYIRTYLQRLLTENKLVTRFAPDRVEALLYRTSPEYRELLQNLYEPVAANAIGLSLLGGGETLLEITPEQAARVHRELAALPQAEANARLAAAAQAACERLRLTDAESAAYLKQAALALLPRLLLSEESAAGVFSACGS